MPYFRNDHVNILFVHIPKTGGTSVEYYFAKKFAIELNNDALYLYDERKNYDLASFESSFQHLTYNQIMRFNKELNINFNNLKIMTIVRNPYERTMSDLFFYKKIHVHSSKPEVFRIMKEFIESHPKEYDNHNLPQYVYVTDNDKNLIPNLRILRTETLTVDMMNMGYDDFNIVENYNPVKMNYYNYLNNYSIQLINDVYHYDFVLFGYKKLSHLPTNRISLMFTRPKPR